MERSLSPLFSLMNSKIESLLLKILVEQKAGHNRILTNLVLLEILH